MPAKKIKIRDYNNNLIISFFRCLNLGFANFWRNKYLSAATVVVIAVIIFIFNIIIAIQHIGSQALTALSERVDIVIYLRDDVENYDAGKLADALAKVQGVKEVKYTSKEEALILFPNPPQDGGIFKEVQRRNPLPPSVNVRPGARTIPASELPEESECKNLMQNYVTKPADGANTRRGRNLGASAGLCAS